MVVGTETDRGLFVGALVAAGYQVYAINPLAVSRYRDRHAVSGAKSDAGDAKVLADLVRTDRHNHRPVAGDSELAEAVKVLARTHQSLVWTRQRQLNQLRSLLREFYPGRAGRLRRRPGRPRRPGRAPGGADPEPLAGACRGPGWPRCCAAPAASAAWRAARPSSRPPCAPPQLAAPTVVAEAYGAAVTALVGVLAALNRQLEQVASQLERHFEQPPGRRDRA